AEIEDKARKDGLPLFPIQSARMLGDAQEPLERLAHIADTTAAEVKKARKAMQEAREAIKPAEALCDITSACRAQDQPLPIELDEWDSIKETLWGSPVHEVSTEVNKGLRLFHFPI